MLRFLVYVAALGLGACAGMHVRIPAALDPPPGEKLAMVLRAEGVQVYECRARQEADGFEWAFVAPEADLFDRQGRRLGTHGAGPYWQAKDGSLVIGTVKARADAPARQAIPWLLLSTASGGPAYCRCAPTFWPCTAPGHGTGPYESGLYVPKRM